MIKAQIRKQKSVRTRQAYPKSRPISADKQLIGQNNTSLPKIKTQNVQVKIQFNTRPIYLGSVAGVWFGEKKVIYD